MATAYEEKRRRTDVRNMLQRVCEVLSDPSNSDTPKWSRSDLFQNKGKTLSYADTSFQSRVLTRLCELGVFRCIRGKGSLNQTRYSVSDADKVLRALEDDEYLSSLIWAKFEHMASLAEETVPVTQPPEEPPPAQEAAPSSEEVLAAILKMVFGLVESTHYLRTKIESIERSVQELASKQAVAAPSVTQPSVGAEQSRGLTNGHSH